MRVSQDCVVVTDHVLGEATEGPGGQRPGGDRERQPKPLWAAWIEAAPAPGHLRGEPAPDPGERRRRRDAVTDGFKARCAGREVAARAWRRSGRPR